MDEVGKKLLLTVGCEAPTARQIRAAVKLNDKFVKGLEKIGGIVRDDAGWKYQPPSTVGQNGEGIET